MACAALVIAAELSALQNERRYEGKQAEGAVTLIDDRQVHVVEIVAFRVTPVASSSPT